jgi:hypothetical protein
MKLSFDDDYCANCIADISKPLLHFTWNIVRTQIDKEVSIYLPTDIKNIVLSYFNCHSMLDYIEDQL